MTYEESEFSECVRVLSREELINVAIELFKQRTEINSRLIENGRILTKMTMDYNAVTAQNAELKKEVNDLKEMLAHTADCYQLNTNELYGRSTEKLNDVIGKEPSKEEVDEADKEPDDNLGKDASKKLNKKERKKPGPRKNRAEDFSHLPQQQRFLCNIEALNDMYGEGNWRIAFWRDHQTLEEVPSSVYVLNTYTPVISVGLEHSMFTIPYDGGLLPHSFVSPSMAAKIIYQKYFLSLPLYRQEMMYANLGLNLSRQTMSNWILTLNGLVFDPIFSYLHELLMENPYHQCDETTLIVNKDGRKAGSKSFIWCHTASELSDEGQHSIVLYCYELTRGTDHLREFYEDFKGYISCDAYVSYKTLSNEKKGVIIICGCMMHMRRRYVDALSLISKSGLDEEAIKQLPEVQALIHIRGIYKADEELKDLSAEECLVRRQEVVKPLVDQYYEYIEGLDTDDPLMGAKLKDAIEYSKNQKEPLCRFLTDGHIPIDNGFALYDTFTYPTLFLTFLVY